MDVTSYSVLTAIACFNVFIAIFALVRRKSQIVFYCGMAPLICICILSVARTVCAVEFFFTHVVTIGGVNWLYETMGIALGSMESEITVGSLAFVLWVGWTMAELLGFAYRTVVSWRYEKRAIWVLEPEILRLCQEITNGRARLAFTERQVPYVVGFFRPIIFISEKPLSEDQLRYVIMHEWQHFKSKDQWKKAAVHFIACVFWWNPFVYLLRLELEQILELRCDQKVLKQLPANERVAYLRMVGGFSDAEQQSSDDKNVLISELVPLKKRRQIRRFRLIKQRLWLGMHYEEAWRGRKILSVALCIIFILAFLASYTINIQPRYWPESQDKTWVTEFSEEAVLVENEDGTYTVMIDEEEWGTISDRTIGPFAFMPIIPFEN